MVDGTHLIATFHATCLYNYYFQTLHFSIESDHHQAFFYSLKNQGIVIFSEISLEYYDIYVTITVVAFESVTCK